jgi:hypothetical protein
MIEHRNPYRSLSPKCENGNGDINININIHDNNDRNNNDSSDSEDYDENTWSNETLWIFFIFFSITLLTIGSLIFNLWDATGLFYSLLFLDDGSVNISGVNFDSANSSFTKQFVTNGGNGYA